MTPKAKATCPACRTEQRVKSDGTLHRHTYVEEWPGCKVRRRCTGSGLPPLGPWPRKGKGGRKSTGVGK